MLGDYGTDHMHFGLSRLVTGADCFLVCFLLLSSQADDIGSIKTKRTTRDVLGLSVPSYYFTDRSKLHMCC